jgi:peptide/nickel transport system permease protein
VTLTRPRAVVPASGFPRFLAGRLVWLLAAVVVVVSATFVLIYVIPADPVSAVLGGRIQADQIEAIKARYGFDLPIWQQYLRFWGGLFRGDLGFSFATQQDVGQAIAARAGATAALAVAGLLLSLLIGVGTGVFAALMRGTWKDRAAMGTVVLGMGVPPFLMGLVLVFVFAYLLPVFPVSGYGSAAHLVLPALTIGLTGGAYYARLLRGRLVEVMDADFVRASRSRGMRESAVFVRHTLRNSFLPVLTWMGMDLGYFLSGVIAVEAIFAWPGIGTLAYRAITDYDTPMIVGTVLVSAVAIVTVNLIIDLVYPLLDPRMAHR